MRLTVQTTPQLARGRSDLHSYFNMGSQGVAADYSKDEVNVLVTGFGVRPSAQGLFYSFFV